MKFTESQLESAIISLFTAAGYPHCRGEQLERAADQVLLTADLRQFLAQRYASQGITLNEINAVVAQVQGLSAVDLYESNKAFMAMLIEGWTIKRDDPALPELFIELLNFDAVDALRQATVADLPRRAAEAAQLYQAGGQAGNTGPADANIYRLVNQLEISGAETRIPDAILYINGLPLVVFEFKSAIRDNATIHHAYRQLTTRYRRDIPQLFIYNAFCVISDGANSKVGAFFAQYDYFYAWRKITGNENVEKDGVDNLHTMILGLFNPTRLCDVIRNFIYLPDKSHAEVKVFCRYPQYYAATKLYSNVIEHIKPSGDGKGGTYFGATGCGKSLTMLFLVRLLMRSPALRSPTIVMITDRTDLDDQLSRTFGNAKAYIGDQHIISVESRQQLRDGLLGRSSGGVFLTTIHKFSEDAQLLSERSNIICISDEAHRSQTNLDQKITTTESGGVKRSYGFAKHLRTSLPQATYIGFTGTPIDATTAVFGPSIDSYTMTESVADDITVRIVYEGRAATVLLDNSKLKEIEAYYAQCSDEGASDYAIDESKKAMAQMREILGDDDRLNALAADFVAHYDKRVAEKATIDGKALFVSSSREIAYRLYQKIIALRPEWAQSRACAEGEALSESEQKEILPLPRLHMVMTRSSDDPKELYDILGSKDFRKTLDTQFKNRKSNFKIALVVDMWLTGFDVPSLDTIYIDKPVQQHNLIQTISRVNRKFEGKHKGLVVDYIGIKRQMNLALAKYAKSDEENIEDIQHSTIVVRDHLNLLDQLFHPFDSRPYFTGEPLAQLDCLKAAAEFVMGTDKREVRFMALVKRLKRAFDICCGNEAIVEGERDRIHYYFAIRSIVFKITKGNAPDTAQMNERVRQLLADALRSDGVEEIIKLGDENESTEVDIFSEDYLAKIDQIKLPHTKIMLLQQLLQRAIAEFKKVNKMQGVDFSKKFQALVDKYNDRSEADTLRSEVLGNFAEEIIGLYQAMAKEMHSFHDLGIDFEEKSFYDILKALAKKYDFVYPEDKLLHLAKEVKTVVDDKAKYTDWSQREDIKAELKVDLIILLAENDYPPVDRDEVYKEIFEQAENFKKHRA
ncbi:MAG: type I restriction endonuclease subunit R [Planctomycetota bacterium]|nr:MAG: type I restriction endonuclease subunit R [Planctomycetota bacterium]